MPVTNTAIQRAQIAVALAIASTLGLPAQTPVAPVMWGSAHDGLRLGISSQSAAAPSERAGFVVSLQNVGANDFVLNLGMMLANGRVMFPDAIGVVLTNPDGRSRELKFFDRRYPGIAGRVDDFIVALRGGATYVLPITLDQYWSESTGEFGVKLKPGRHRIAVRFDGRGAAHVNLDTPGVKLLNFWHGTVNSGVLEFYAR